MADQLRRRAHENIPGEATLSQLLPKGWTLLLTIGMGIAYAAFTYSDIEALAGSAADLVKSQEQQEERIRELEKQGASAAAEREAFRREQKVQAQAAHRDRKEILEEIRRNRRP